MAERLNSLGPETFAIEDGRVCWRFWTTDTLGQFDVAVPPDDDFNPDPGALTYLARAIDEIDVLYDRALSEAEKGWAARYKGPLRSRDAWSLIRLFADPAGKLVLSLNEGDFDTYCLWDVTLVGGHPAGIEHRAWGASSS